MKKYYAISGISENKAVVDIFENIGEDDAEVITGYYFESSREAENFEKAFNSSNCQSVDQIDIFYKNFAN